MVGDGARRQGASEAHQVFRVYGVLHDSQIDDVTSGGVKPVQVLA